VILEMKMKIFRLFVPLCLTAFMVTACAYPMTLFLFNNTGHEFVIESISTYHEKERVEVNKLQKIPVNMGIEIRAPGDQRKGWTVSARSGECKLVYFIPSSVELNQNYWDPELRGSRKASAYIKIQIEPDFTIHLIPQKETSIVDVNNFKNLQEGVFPITFQEKTCAD